MTFDSENKLIAQRRAQLKELREKGIAYPNDFKRDSLARNLHSQFDGHSKEQLESEPMRVVVAGRMMSRRVMGKASFAHLQDMSGRIQLYVKQDELLDGV
ncbi:MAG: OB-fold nucleic acid binding domain-containing protein, partial [Gammaproteobacteria bacterium]